ncbi:aldo/keto reductase [Rufibacter tibetensis]|uniref:Alcohol dehydrogenase n=1 Tax=Rufibacter tibetensis TaxID=512763 RepID=A0A0P0CB51_9BACT|nr:aldo/keto reductase [Rufibacter tibetensis]ALJ00875.1 alcohol dehydrogenase [Rufibacter tibetensis]
MKKRMLGKSGLEVAPLAYGGNVFGWTIDEKTSFQLLDAFTDAGFNLIDTADSYSNWVPGNKGGESETIIGNWVKSRGNRENVVIATKVGSELSSERKGLNKAHILKSVDESLQRLKTDYIDLYQSHFDDESTPIEETLEAYSQVVQSGKVRAIGASNFSVDRLKQSLEISRQHHFPIYQTLQPDYNLYTRQEFEAEMEQLCLQEEIGVINYFALASGFLTGKYRSEADLSKSQRGGGIKKYLNERGFNILTALDEVAARHNANPAQVSLAWLMARPSITAPIASATSLNQLEDLTKAAQLTITQLDIDLLDKASSY